MNKKILAVIMVALTLVLVVVGYSHIKPTEVKTNTMIENIELPEPEIEDPVVILDPQDITDEEPEAPNIEEPVVFL